MSVLTHYFVSLGKWKEETVVRSDQKRRRGGFSEAEAMINLRVLVFFLENSQQTFVRRQQYKYEEMRQKLILKRPWSCSSKSLKLLHMTAISIVLQSLSTFKVKQGPF